MIERYPLLILAGGASARMGGEPKGLLDFHGRLWLEEQLSRFASAGGRGARIVIGARAEEYQARLSSLAASMVVNAHPERGPFSSLQRGLEALVADFPYAPGVWVLPVDVPCPAPVVFETLVAALGRSVAAVPCYHGRGGHPVLLSRVVFEGLLAIDPLSPEGRLDHWLHARAPGEVMRVECSDTSVCSNLNEPETWARFVADSSSRQRGAGLPLTARSSRPAP